MHSAMKGVLLVVFFALFVSTFGSVPRHERTLESRDTKLSARNGAPRQTKRDTFPAEFTEITGTVSGTLAGGEVRKYLLHLDAHQVADINIGFDDYFNALYSNLVVYEGATSHSWSWSGNMTDYYDYTLARHCPEFSTKYMFEINTYDDYPTNFTLKITKRSSDFPAGQTFYSGIANSFDYEYIGFPITNASVCQKLVYDVWFDNYVDTLDFIYKCRYYSSDCQDVGADMQYIYKSGNYTTQNHYQFYVNCTSVGTYYMFLYSYGSDRAYNVTVNSGYPCPEGCWTNGMCHLDTGVCECNEGWEGANCTTSTTGGETPTGPIVYVEVDLPVNGIPFNMSAAAQMEKRTQLKVDFTPDPASTIRIKMDFLNYFKSKYISGYIYYQLQNYADGESSQNYSAYTYLSSNQNRTIEVQLCAAQAPWYLYFTMNTAVDVLLTAEMVPVTAITGDSFSGSFGPSANYLTPNVYQYQATSTSAAIQVNTTYPLLYGIGLWEACSVFQDNTIGSTRNSRSTDFNYNYGRYQVSTSFTVNKTYWFMVLGTPGANYTGTIITSGPTQCQSCSGGSRGFCSPGSYCICRNGYKGGNCSEIDVPAAALVAQANTPLTFQLQNGSFFDTIVYIALPVLPAGSSMMMSVQSTTEAYMYIQTFVPRPLPAPLSANYQLTIPKNSIQVHSFSQCVVRQPTQYYLAVNPQKGVGGDITIRANISNTVIPNDGTPVTLVMVGNGANAFISNLPTSCAAAYYVTVTGNIGYAYVGEGYSSCFSETQIYMTQINSTTKTYADVVPIKNCNSSIDIRIVLYSSDQTVTITVEPTTPCPNNCNANWGGGVCKLGGVCKCNYPFIGNDCTNYDSQCAILPDPVGFCKSDTPSSYYTDFLDVSDYCEIQYASYEAGQNVLQFLSELAEYEIPISTNCKLELQQIFCDSYKYKCQSQESGGVKLMLPCNAQDWLSRCASKYEGYFYTLENIKSNQQQYLAQYPGFYVCNPVPFLPANYSSTSTGTPSSGPSSGSSTTSSPSGSSTTANNNSDASRLVYFSSFILCVLAFALAL